MAKLKEGEFIEQLKAQEKVKVRIPLREGEKPDAFEVVSINGHIYQIQKGKDVEVPVGVRAILIKSGRI